MTLGQVAYEAHHADPLVPAELIRSWWTRSHEQARWQAAAEAVVHEVLPRPEIDDLDARVPLAVAERAVIEAAKALVREQREGTPSSVAAAEWEHAKAVDALLALEKGEE